MKKNTINCSWPVKFENFTEEKSNENELFTRGKLKVFYKGETADHRYFSDDFSKELIKSLPYTPIVSHYDAEKDDFVGHATEQNIYGIVDPCKETSFVEEEGITWCVCDVVLYTERPDSTGNIAQKIIGHPQSLELDPKTVQYVINYDDKRHFKNIEFTAGKFVGVSVLGNDQRPAFTGSAFFSYDENFESKMKILRDYCEQKEDQQTDGGKVMNLQEFMKLSWGDISIKVGKAISKEYEEEAYVSIVDYFDDCVIARFYSYVDGSTQLCRIRYSCNENGEVTLGEVNEVHVVYEDVQQIENAEVMETGVEQAIEINVAEEKDIQVENVADAENIENNEENVENNENEDLSCGDNPEETDKKDKEEDNNAENCELQEPVVDAACDSNAAEQAAQVSDAEVTDTEKKVNVENETQQTTDSGSTSFTESEREELETLKREKKISLVDSYKDSLTEEEYNNFVSNIDNFTSDNLELELLRIYKKNVPSRSKSTSVFAFSPLVEKSTVTESSIDSFVKKYKR